MRKYRKKPVEISAEQLSMENATTLIDQMFEDGVEARLHSEPPMRAVTGIQIETLEGTMTGKFGDYIIKGIQGEYYPCKPEIFENSYEEVTQ